MNTQAFGQQMVLLGFSLRVLESVAVVLGELTSEEQIALKLRIDGHIKQIEEATLDLIKEGTPGE